MARIVIGGDYCPIGINGPLARSSDAEHLFGDLLPLFEGADLSMVNLECPLVSFSTPVRKSGPVLQADESCLEGIVAAGIDVVGLANNHTMDHGPSGLSSTFRSCERYGISTVGAGRDLAAARRVLIREAGPYRVGVAAMAEHEFGIARRNRAGVNPLDTMAFVRSIESVRHQVDFLVVLIHGGNEHYPYPRPSLKDTCRFLVEQGADAVVCQHSHCPGCFESYQGAHIIYGQGNLIFDMKSDYPTWYEGFLVCLDVFAEHRSTLDVVPLVQSRPVAGARRMLPEDEARFLRLVEGRVRAIADSDFVEDQWDRYCQRMERHYVRRFGAPHRLFRGLDKLTGFLQFLYSRWPTRMEHLNLVRCESHREVLINVLSREPASRRCKTRRHHE